jgi:hypothetical protein
MMESHHHACGLTKHLSPQGISIVFHNVTFYNLGLENSSERFLSICLIHICTLTILMKYDVQHSLFLQQNTTPEAILHRPEYLLASCQELLHVAQDLKSPISAASSSSWNVLMYKSGCLSLLEVVSWLSEGVLSLTLCF